MCLDRRSSQVKTLDNDLRLKKIYHIVNTSTKNFFFYTIWMFKSWQGDYEGPIVSKIVLPMSQNIQDITSVIKNMI
jgi:hypothetical protein